MKIQYKDKTFEISGPKTIQELLKDEIENSKHAVIGAIFNNEYVNLEFMVDKDGKIELIDVSSKEGMKIYRRTLTYVLGKAFEKVCPNKKITINGATSIAKINNIFSKKENTINRRK